MAIHVVTGINGGGKSAYACWLLSQWPHQIVTNLELRPSHPRFQDAILLGGDKNPVACESCGYGIWSYGFRNTMILLDEADLYFDCFSFDMLRHEGWPWFKQQRKSGLDIVLIVQRAQTLYNRLRMLAADYIWCQRDNRMGHWLKYFLPDCALLWRRLTCLDANLQTVVSCQNSFPHEIKPYFGMYDTQQKILPTLRCRHCTARLKHRALREAMEKHRSKLIAAHVASTFDPSTVEI